jgi:hypothetical protein
MSVMGGQFVGVNRWANDDLTYEMPRPFWWSSCSVICSPCRTYWGLIRLGVRSISRVSAAESLPFPSNYTSCMAATESEPPLPRELAG